MTCIQLRLPRGYLREIKATPVVEKDLVEAIWLILILHLLRGCSFSDSPFELLASELNNEVRRLLGDWNEVGSPQPDCIGQDAFAEATQLARNQWNLEANGYWALLRLHRATESDFVNFIRFLDNLVIPDGPIPRRLLVHLSLMPVGFWNTAPQDLNVRLRLQSEIFPKLGKILGEPIPGVVSQIVEGTTITEIEY